MLTHFIINLNYSNEQLQMLITFLTGQTGRFYNSNHYSISDLFYNLYKCCKLWNVINPLVNGVSKDQQVI